MNRKLTMIHISLLLSLLVFNSLQAQWLLTMKNDFFQSLKVGKALGTKMFSPSTSSLAVGLGTIGLSVFDESVIEIFRSNQNHFNDQIFEIDRLHGQKNVLLPTSLVLYSIGLISGNSAIRETGLKSGQAMIYSGVIVVALKELFGRARPYQNKGGFTFQPFSFEEKWRSFPSGHAELSFAFSTVLAHSMDALWWKLFWYSSAFLVAGARMYHDKHWLSDVTAGALIGWSVGKFVCEYPAKNTKDQSFTVRPLIRVNQPFYAAVQATFSF